MKKIKRMVSLIICIVLCSNNVVLHAKESTSMDIKKEEKEYSIGEMGGYLSGNVKSIKNIYQEKNFLYPGGQGFAAEKANNLTDVMRGKKAKVIGGDNAKDGADRRIINRDGTVTWIQDKYWNTAKQSIEDAFDKEKGMYRYMDSDNKPMQLEVPKDQYDEAVLRMQDKIKDGKVKGVSNPDEAKNIVRKGKYTFKQAENITKAFNKDSIIYDTKQGCITATCAIGISFALNYMACLLNGEDHSSALKDSCMEALKTGGVVTVTYVVSSQLSKTGMKNALIPASEAIVKTFGKDFAKELVENCNQKATTLTGEQLTRAASEALARKVIVNGVMIVVLEVPDIVDIFQGRISTQQFVKNLSVTLGSIGGMTIGAKLGTKIGTAIAPGAGTVVGVIIGAVGGAGAGIATEKISSYIYEGDAEKMYEIVTEEFQNLCEDYVLSEQEAASVTEEIQDIFKEDTLKDMFASDNQKKYAKN